MVIETPCMFDLYYNSTQMQSQGIIERWQTNSNMSTEKGKSTKTDNSKRISLAFQELDEVQESVLDKHGNTLTELDLTQNNIRFDTYIFLD